ncbi:MAG: ABC transporter permease [Anaerolineae bacterium]
MKVLDIALKDLLRSFRNVSALFFMFVLPLMTVGLIYFAFSGLAGDEGGFDLQVTRVQVVNLDQPASQFGGFSGGQMLVEFLQDERLTGLLQVTVAADEASARAAVDQQDAGVAVIIPPDFTAAALAPEGGTAVALYQDPTLTVGPAIVKGLVSQFVDGFAGTIIAAGVVADQLDERGVTVDASVMNAVTDKYVAWAQTLSESQSQGVYQALDVQSPPSKAEPVDLTTKIITGIMSGMLVFYAFFTGAATAESIIREDEEKTLPRLFTTPTSRTAILGGKFLAVFVTIIVQVIVTMIAGRIIFGVRWGEPLPVALAALGLVVVAAGSGVLLMSFLKSTRQTGPVMGGVLTITGMAGGLFTTGFPSLPAAFETATLFVPQGWAMRGWKLALAGGGVNDVLLPAVVTLGIGIVFFVIGAFVFRKRFA